MAEKFRFCPKNNGFARVRGLQPSAPRGSYACGSYNNFCPSAFFRANNDRYAVPALHCLGELCHFFIATNCYHKPHESSSAACHYNHRGTSQGVGAAAAPSPTQSGKSIIFRTDVIFSGRSSSQNYILYLLNETRSSATAERQRVSYTRVSRLTH